MLSAVGSVGWSFGQVRNDSAAYSLTAQAAQLIHEGRYRDADDVVQRADRLPEVSEIMKFQIRCAQLRVLLAQGEYKAAQALFRRTLRDESPDEECDDELRLIYSEYGFLTGDYTSALAELDSMQTDKFRYSAATHRIRLLTLMEHYDAAIALADSLLTRPELGRTDRAYILQNQGYACWMRHDLPAGIRAVRSALTLLPDGADKYNIQGNLALMEAENGECDQALKDIATVMAHQDHSTTDGLINSRKEAEILFHCGRRVEAARAFHTFAAAERNALLRNLPQMTTTQRLNYWAKEKPLLSKCFLLGDADAEFLFDVAMFRRQTSLLGIRDTTNLKRLLCVTAKEVRQSLRPDEAALEIVSYEPRRDEPAYAAIVLTPKGRARFVPLCTEAEIYAPETVGDNSLYNAVKREDALDKNLLYTDSLWGRRIWDPILQVLPQATRRIYFAPEGIFHLLAIENLPFAGRSRLKLHRLTSIAALTERGKATKGHKTQRALVVGGLDYNALPTDSLRGEPNHDAAEYLSQRGMGAQSALFSYLRGTKTEADTIARIWATATLRHEMSEATLKTVMPEFDIVHLATHGYSLNVGIKKRPELIADSIPYDASLLASGLALTGANVAHNQPQGEDAILSARELCDLDLSRVEFVVLSACQTAKGDISDEGPAGLVRGLKNAGIRTILATLWSVDDASTMRFMQAFYTALTAGASPYDAYWQAQDYVRNYLERTPYRKFSPKTLARGKEVYYHERSYAKPYYWAPFILIDAY
jgi:CHAT domain-containing protein